MTRALTLREDGKNDQDEEASPWLGVDNLCRAAAAAAERSRGAYSRGESTGRRCGTLSTPTIVVAEQHDWDIDARAGGIAKSGRDCMSSRR